MSIRSLLLVSLSPACELPEHPLESAFDVHYAESLEAAFTIISCEEIDMLLIDCDSMRSNLMIVLQLLEINPLTASMPILLLDSSNSFEESHKASKQTQVLGTISKEVPLHELSRFIQKAGARREH